jgi:hypothetical protein
MDDPAINKDGLLYVNGEVVQTDFAKCLPLKGMRAAICATGPASFGYHVAGVLEANCASFDEVVSLSSDWYRGLFDWYANRYRNGNAVATLVMVGWSESENRPACFVIELSTEGSEKERIRRNSPHTRDEDMAHELTEVPIIANPTPAVDAIKAAGWPLLVEADDRNVEADLLQMLEIQRRMQQEDSKCYVGGQAVLTTVNAKGVTQRVVHTWPEDKVGEAIEPREIDWAKWRMEREEGGLSGSNRVARTLFLSGSELLCRRSPQARLPDQIDRVSNVVGNYDARITRYNQSGR